MGNEVIGYVKSKATGKIYPFYEKDDNGYSVLVNGIVSWSMRSNWMEVEGPEEMQTNTHIKNVHDIIDNQQEKGLKKYGTLVNKDDYSLIGWIEHAQQEAADLLIYLEVIKAKVKDVIG